MHLLLFMLRKTHESEDLLKAHNCLQLLEKSTYTKVIVYHSVVCIGQRTGVHTNIMISYYVLEKLYGAIGIKHLSHIHKIAWSEISFNGICGIGTHRWFHIKTSLL